MIHDPMRGQKRSLLVGLVLAIIVVGACAVLAFFKPQPSVGDAQILMSQSNGAVFVRIGDRVHPALNLASARLISGKSDKPAAVDDKKLSALQRGPLVGIVGAPTTIAGGDDMSTSHWTVCDTTRSPAAVESTGSQTLETVVLANLPELSPEVRAAGNADAALVEADGQNYLVYDGVRAPVDLTDPVVVNALHLTGVAPRPASPGLLNSFTLVPAVTAVVVPGAGTPAPAPLPPSVRVGGVIRVSETAGDRLFVVLQNGVQPVSPATADIIRYGDPTADQQPQTISPALLTQLPQVSTLAVTHYPAVTPAIAPVTAAPVLCFSWARGNTESSADTSLLVGRRLPIPADAATVPLAGADGDGPSLDGVYLKPGSGEYVQAVGSDPAADPVGQLFYIADTGQRYHIKDSAAAGALGVHGVEDPQRPQADAEIPQPAPWPVLSLLPAGPELSQEAALIAHDGMAADPAGRRLNPPSN